MRIMGLNNKRWMPVLLTILLAPSVSAEVMVNEDLTDALSSAAFFFSPAVTHEEGTGAILVDDTQYRTGLIGCRMPVHTENIAIRLECTLTPGPHGFGDGLAVGILDTTAPEMTGTGQGLFGLGNFPDCLSALLVEFDTFSNDPEDFGAPADNALHAGIAHAGMGPVTGDTFLPTSTACDLSTMVVPGEPLHLRVDIHIQGNTITVLTGFRNEAPLFVMTEKLHDIMPFSGYLIIGASNGQFTGRAILSRLTVVTDMIKAPALNAAATADDGALLTWEVDGMAYDGFHLFRDGLFQAELNGTARSWTDVDLLPGEHTYEIRGWTNVEGISPPAAATVITGRPYLVVDAVSPGDTPSPSATAWMAYLYHEALPYVRKSGLAGLNLADFQAVIWVHGAGVTQRMLTDEEGNQLAGYLADVRGARLYMEGADLWPLSSKNTLANHDGIVGLRDGWPATQIMDEDGYSHNYIGQSCQIAEIKDTTREIPVRHTILWRRTDNPNPSDPDPNSPALTIVAEVPDGRSVFIASSVELSRIEDADIQYDTFTRYLSWLGTSYEAVLFLRGDTSQDGQVNLADAIGVLSYLFENTALPCPDAADTNDDGDINLGDAINLLGYLFSDNHIPQPGPVHCGEDPTADLLAACQAEQCP